MRTETQLQDFVELGRAAQDAVDASLARVPDGRRAAAAIESLHAFNLDDLRCLSDQDLRRLVSCCRDWLALGEFEQGTRDGQRLVEQMRAKR